MSAASFTPDPSWPSITEIATKLWGEPTHKTPKELRFGERGSKSVIPHDNLWHDHEAGEGGGYKEAFVKAFGHWPPNTDNVRTFVPKPKPAKTNGHDKQYDGIAPWDQVIKARYQYRDADGTLILEVIRTELGEPRFVQRKPDRTAISGWKWSTRDIPQDDRPLYRFPELLASDPALPVFICEGEKDADNVAKLGLTATTNVGGADASKGTKWRPCYAEHFAGRHVVILPDNDVAGAIHAQVVARSLHGVAASLRVIPLPGLAEKGDVSDWIEAGGGARMLMLYAERAPLWEVPPPPPPGGGDEGDPPPPPPPGDDDPGGPGDAEPLPVITCAAGELPRMLREAEDALIKAGMPIYQRTTLVRPTTVEYAAAPPSGSKEPRRTHSTAMVNITPAAMLGMLSKVAQWQKWDARRAGGGAFVSTDPPQKVVDVLLAMRGDWRFPVIRGVLTTPTVRYDGSLLTTPGYDEDSRYFLSFPSNLTVPEIPEAPDKFAALEALEHLNGLLDGYEFSAVEPDGLYRSVALSILMTQVLRCGMPVSPLLAVSATAPGSGKSHLVDLASHIATGRWCPVMNAGRDDNETEKGINTKLISGTPGFSIDNVHKSLNLEALNTATERPQLSPRDFGVLKDIEVENGAVIYMTGNNLHIPDEQVRRTMYCKLDSASEQPEQREFPLGDPITAVLADRGRYIADILTITRAYQTHIDRGGAKPDIPPYGSFQHWDHFVRHPLVWLGQPDPLRCQEYLRKNDEVQESRSALIETWRACFAEKPMTLAAALKHAMDVPTWFDIPGEDPHARVVRLAAYTEERDSKAELLAVMREMFPANSKEGVETTKWAGWLRKFSDRKTGGWRFTKHNDGGKGHHGTMWKVVKG